MRSKEWPSQIDKTDPENQEILAFLDSENKYAKSFFDKFEEEKEYLFQEIKSRIKLEDESLPVKRDEYYYYSKTKEDSQYSLYYRKYKSLEAEPQLILDVNLGQG